MKYKYSRPHQGGTYLFLLFIMALLSMMVLGASLIESIGGRRDREKYLIFIGGEFERAFLSYQNASAALGDDPRPYQIDDLVEDRRGGRLVRHLRKMYFDPINGSRTWGEVRVAGRLVGVYSLATEVAFRVRHAAAPFPENESKSERYSDWVFGATPN